MKDMTEMYQIAHFKIYRLLINIVILLTMVVFIPYITFLIKIGFSIPGNILPSRLIIIIPAGLFVWIFMPHMIYLLVVSLRQMIFCDAAAIWIAEESLIFWDKRIFSVKCDEVISVSPGTFRGTFGAFTQEAIVLNLRDGQKKMIVTANLRESSDYLCLRLGKVLNVAVLNRP